MNNFLLEAQTAANGGGGFAGTLMTFLPIILMIAIFYFLMIRPQKKQEKEVAAMRNSLQIGDEVTTIGGIVGRVTHIKEDIVTIETGADRNKIRFRRAAIQTVDKRIGEEKAPKGGYTVKKSEKKSGEEAAPAIEAAPLKDEKKSDKTDKE